MLDDLLAKLTTADLPKYTVEINVTGDWVSFRHPVYPANSVSYGEEGEKGTGPD